MVRSSSRKAEVDLRLYLLIWGFFGGIPGEGSGIPRPESRVNLERLWRRRLAEDLRKKSRKVTAINLVQ